MKTISLNFRMAVLCLALAALGVLGAAAAEGGKKAAPPIKLQLPQAAPADQAPAPAAADKISSDTVILKINGEEIKEGRLDEIMDQKLRMIAAQLGPMFNPDSLPPTMKENLRVVSLKELKDKVLLDQAIKEMKYTPSDEEIQKEWDLMDMRVKMGKGEDASLKAEIEAAQKEDPQVNEAYIRDNLKNQLQAMKVIDKEMKSTLDPSAEEIQKIYDKDPLKWGRMRASHILIGSQRQPSQGDAAVVDKEALAKAEEALKEVKAGKDFAELAKKYSDDKGNADKGGDLDYFYYESMVPDFADAAFKLKKNETSGLVRSEFGYHIIKAVDFQPIKLDDAKNKLDTRKRIQLYTRQSRLKNNLTLAMMELAKRAKIEDMLNPAPAKGAPAPAKAETAPAKAEKK